MNLYELNKVNPVRHELVHYEVLEFLNRSIQAEVLPLAEAALKIKKGVEGLLGEDG
jgi:hypothetical protein